MSQAITPPDLTPHEVNPEGYAAIAGAVIACPTNYRAGVLRFLARHLSPHNSEHADRMTRAMRDAHDLDARADALRLDVSDLDELRRELQHRLQRRDREARARWRALPEEEAVDYVRPEPGDLDRLLQAVVDVLRCGSTERPVAGYLEPPGDFTADVEALKSARHLPERWSMALDTLLSANMLADHTVPFERIDEVLTKVPGWLKGTHGPYPVDAAADALTSLARRIDKVAADIDDDRAADVDADVAYRLALRHRAWCDELVDFRAMAHVVGEARTRGSAALETSAEYPVGTTGWWARQAIGWGYGDSDASYTPLPPRMVSDDDIAALMSRVFNASAEWGNDAPNWLLVGVARAVVEREMGRAVVRDRMRMVKVLLRACKAAGMRIGESGAKALWSSPTHTKTGNHEDRKSRRERIDNLASGVR